MDIITAGRQTRRIRVLFEYSLNQRLHIRAGLGPELQKSFVNSLTHHIGQVDSALAKRACLAETLGIEAYADQTRTHEYSVYEVIEGELEITAGGVTRIARPGIVAIVPGNVPHSVKALTAGRPIIIDYPLRGESR